METLQQVAEWEGVALHPGDILLLRTGWTTWHDSLRGDEAKMIALTRDKHENAGLLAAEETAAWIWFVYSLKCILSTLVLICFLMQEQSLCCCRRR